MAETTTCYHHITPSAISIMPNANGKSSDLAIYVARGAKIKVFCPDISGLEMSGTTYREWALAGRNRHLAESGRRYAIYARLNKNDNRDGYLVFAAMNQEEDGSWSLPYVLSPNTSSTAVYHTDEPKKADWQPIPKAQTAYNRQNYWWILLGTVSEADGNDVRTVSFDTGNLGTDEFNATFKLNPDELPLRMELAATIDDEDAGNTPYVFFGKTVFLDAKLLEGWSESGIEVDHWEITRNSGDEESDAEWNERHKDDFRQTGTISLLHTRDTDDDFGGAVAATFTVTAWVVGGDEEEPVEEDLGEEQEPEDVEGSRSLTDGDESPEGGESSDDEGGSDDGAGSRLVAIATGSITILAETVEKYDLVLSSNVVAMDAENGGFSPDSVTVVIRATDQRGNVFTLTRRQLDDARLRVEVSPSGQAEWTPLTFSVQQDTTATAHIDCETHFAARKSLDVRLRRAVSPEPADGDPETEPIYAELQTLTITYIADDSGQFLSAVDDDEAQGLIGFLKGLWVGIKGLWGIDKDGNAKFNDLDVAGNGKVDGDLKVGGIFDAIEGKIDRLRSHNYSGSALGDTGWLLTNNDGSGHSLLEVDNLLVRMKATFMELEIRKESFVGGNSHYSPAGSVVFKVDFLTADNQPIGYKIQRVPWLLRGFAFLFGKNKADGRNKVYTRQRYIRYATTLSQLTPEDLASVAKFRLYLISDDGTTATRNWWQVGDQARCQTFNKALSRDNKRDNIYDTTTPRTEDPATPMSSDYYWRLITEVGSSVGQDGKVYDWVEMPYEGRKQADGRDYYTTSEKDSFRDPGSGMPQAGDTIVCMGNRYNQDRMNLVSILSVGSDAPAIKGYRGIHTFSLAETQVFNISPVTKVSFRSSDFEFIADDGTGFPVVMELGEWIAGHRYHWYDRVSHNGAMWLCMLTDGRLWVNAQGTEYDPVNHKWLYPDGTEGDAPEMTGIIEGEGNFEYTVSDWQLPALDVDDTLDGDEVYHGLDHYYRRASVGNQTIYYVRKFTYAEPKDTNSAIWLKQVSGTDVTEVRIAYAASSSGVVPPVDGWKVVGTGAGEYPTVDQAIAATGIRQGQYLWLRRMTYYSDHRDPVVEYMPTRWGIDGDGVSSQDSYYYATKEPTTINADNDNYPNEPLRSEYDSDAAYNAAHAVWAAIDKGGKWFGTFDALVTAWDGLDKMQGMFVWEKTVIIYDRYYTEATAEKDAHGDYIPGKAPGDPIVNPPRLVSYRCSRIGQDGQIGQEEYYCLLSSDVFQTAFGSRTPGKDAIGICWSKQSSPATDNYRLANSTSQQANINTGDNPATPATGFLATTPFWQPIRPAYTIGSQNKYLWNFELRIDGMGNQYATRPVCIGDSSRGIAGVIELYACSSSQTPYTDGSGNKYPIPKDLYDKNGFGTIPTTGFSDLKVWADEKYDRAPTEGLPYQWNWTRTLYTTPKNAQDTARHNVYDSQGRLVASYPYEDRYHVSAVKGTRGEDGAGDESIYFLVQTRYMQGDTLPEGKVVGDLIDDAACATNYNDTKGQYSPGYDSQGVPIPAVERDTYSDTKDDWVPQGWTDNPRGMDAYHEVEYRAVRKLGAAGTDGKRKWGQFAKPQPWSTLGVNGEDGDGVEYCFLRTKKNVPPIIGYPGYTDHNGKKASDAKFLPKITNPGADGCDAELNVTGYPGECTDNPKGATAEWPYEWYAKRNMNTPNLLTGKRTWRGYYECMEYKNYQMLPWKTYTPLRLDIDNEMDMVQTNSARVITAARTVQTVVSLYDAGEKVNLTASGAPTINISGGPATSGTGKIADYSTADSGSDKVLKWAFIKDKTMADAYNITISLTYKNMDYSAVFTIVASKGLAIFQLKPSHSALHCTRNSSGALQNPPALSLNIEVVDSNVPSNLNSFDNSGCVTYDSKKYYIRYSKTSMPTAISGTGSESAWPTGNSVQVLASEVTAATPVTNVYIALFTSDGTLLDRETVPVLTDGKDGKNGIRLDLDNQADLISLDSNGKVRFARTVVVKARIYDGGSVATTGVSKSDGVTPSTMKIGAVEPTVNFSNGVLTITWSFAKGVAANADTKTITLIYNNVAYSAVFSLGTTDADAIYQVMPNPSEVSFSRNSSNVLKPDSQTLKCGYTKSTGSGTESVGAASVTNGQIGTTGLYIYYRSKSNDSWGSWNTYATAGISVGSSTTVTDYEFCISSASSASSCADSNIIDRECVPVVKDGIDGAPGTSPYFADLDNEMDSVACTAAGLANGEQALYTTVALYKGSTPLTINSLVVHDEDYNVNLTTSTQNGVKASFSTGHTSEKITLTFANNAPFSTYPRRTFKITLSNTAESISRDLYFTVNGLRPGPDGKSPTIYNLLPNPDQVSVGRSGSDYNPRYNTLKCGYKKSYESSISVVEEATGDIDSTYRIFFRRKARGGNWETTWYYYNNSTYKAYLVPTSSAETGLDVKNYDKVEFVLYKDTSSNTLSSLTTANIIDKETVPVVADGITTTTYELLPSITQIKATMNSSGKLITSQALTCGYKKSEGNTITSSADAQADIDGYRIFYRRRLRSTGQWETKSNGDACYIYYSFDNAAYGSRARAILSALNVDRYDMVEFYLTKNNNTASATSVDSTSVSDTTEKTSSVYVATSVGDYIDKKTVTVVSDGEPSMMYSLKSTPDVANFRMNAVGDWSNSYVDIVCAVYKTVGDTTSIQSSYSGYYLNSRKLYASGNAGSWSVSSGSYVTEGTKTHRVTIQEATNTAVSACVIGIEFGLSTSVQGASFFENNIVARMTVPVLLDGRIGPEGIGTPGKIFYPMGEWDMYEYYTRENEFIPLVHYGDTWNSDLGIYGKYYYLVADDDIGTQPGTDSDVWVEATQFGLVITQGVFAEFAKLGKAIMSGDYMFSMNGRIGDTEYIAGANYNGKPAYINFCPPIGSISKTNVSGYTSSSRLVLFTIKVVNSCNLTVKFSGKTSTGTGYFEVLNSYNSDISGASISERTINTTGKASQYTVALSEGTYRITFHLSNSGRALNFDCSYSLDGGVFEPNWWVDLLSGTMVAARGNFVALPNGDVEISGTIKAKNFYHKVCVIYGGNYSGGLYYNGPGDYGETNTGTDTVPCTGDADVVCVYVNGPGERNNPLLYLPRAADYQGKMVTIYAYDDSHDPSTSYQFYIQAKGGSKFPEQIRVNDSGNIVSGPSSSFPEDTPLHSDMTTTFISVYCNSQWCWARIS